MSKNCEYCGDELTCAQCEPNEYVRSLQFELMKTKEKSQKRMLALESLTPSGSEFVGDVEMCIEFVNDRHRRDFESVKREVVRRKKAEDNLNSAGCILAGSGRGDCEHAVGLPGKSIPGQHDGDDDTVDVYGKPNGWCWMCWKDHQIRELQKELQQSSRHAGMNWKR